MEDLSKQKEREKRGWKELLEDVGYKTQRRPCYTINKSQNVKESRVYRTTFKTYIKQRAL